MISIFIGIVFETWLVIILLCSADVHPDPGPSSTSSTASSINFSLDMSQSLPDSLSLNHNLSFIRYNVQSVLAKLDILHAELILIVWRSAKSGLTHLETQRICLLYLITNQN